MSFLASPGGGWSVADSRSPLPLAPTAGIPGSGPCHWKNDAFGASNTFTRCGYPTRLTGTEGQTRLRWWFGGYAGGGGSGSGKIAPGANPPSPAPVPLPAAGWLLLAALALPRLLRRR